MNVLVVSPDFPFPPRGGANMRVYQLTRQLAARHRVIMLSYAAPEHRDGVRELRDQIDVRTVQRPRPSTLERRALQLRSLASRRPFTVLETYSREMQRAIDEICATEQIDVIQLEGAILAGFSTPPGVTVILDEHNIDYEVFLRMREHETSTLRRLFHRLEYLRFRPFEERAWKRVDGCAVTSTREEPVIHAVAPDTVTAVVPNSVDLEYFAPCSAPVVPRTLVFNATLAYRPNVEGAQHLVDDIWPLILDRCPDARLHIVGRATEADRRRLTRPGVTVTGEVPDIRPYLEQAAVVAVPVRMGGGTRLKVVEGLAMGKAMVSTTLGCEGVSVRDGEHLLIGDDAEAFAGRVLQLFGDAELRARLGTAGRHLIEAEYSWELAAEQLDRIYQAVRPSGIEMFELAGGRGWR